MKMIGTVLVSQITRVLVSSATEALGALMFVNGIASAPAAVGTTGVGAPAVAADGTLIAAGMLMLFAGEAGRQQVMDYQASSNNTDLRRFKTSTQHSIPHNMPPTHTKKHVPNGKKTSEKKPLQTPNPFMRNYKGVKKRLTSRTATDLIKAEIKGRDDRPSNLSND